MALLHKSNVIFKGEKIILGLALVYLFILIHFLAVRSGILILYVNLFVFFIIRTIRSKKYILGIAFIVGITATPFIAYLSIPTFKEKVQYSILDFKMSKQDKEVAFSDGERLRSYEVGWELFAKGPIGGIGVGDIFKEYEDLYEVKYFIKSPTRLPHNQFLTIAVSTGMVGLLFFLISFIFPFTFQSAYKDPFLLALFILMFLSFLVENTIERQYSVGFYLIFLLLGLNTFSQNTVALDENEKVRKDH